MPTSTNKTGHPDETLAQALDLLRESQQMHQNLVAEQASLVCRARRQLFKREFRWH